MKIRSRLLFLILPTVLVVILSVSFLCYRTWYQETLTYFKESLEAIVVSSAEIVDAEGHEWLVRHKDDRDILDTKTYQKYSKALKNVRKNLPITSLYTVKIEPVKLGEPVLLSEPVSEKNTIYNGKDPQHAWRQIYILDTGSSNEEPFRRPGDMDFSEVGEAKVYTTKQPFVTPVYQSPSTGLRFMTGFAPIMTEEGQVVGLVAADLSMDVLDKKAHEIQSIIFLGAVITVVLIMIALAFVANNISQPVEKLKNAALTLAGGNYGKKIEVGGPQEITELANTLNTLSECLCEHISRLEESSLLREKMIGEVECVRILQTKLIQGVADKFGHPEIALKTIGKSIRSPHRSMVLEIVKNEPDATTIRFKEANYVGFDGIYELIQGAEASASTTLFLTKEKEQWHLKVTRKNMPCPIVWKTKTSEIVSVKTGLSLDENDFILLVNSSLDERIRHHDSLHHWFTRVFRHFAEEGIDACTALLTNELAFLAHKHDLKEPLQAICLQITPKTFEETSIS